MTTSLDALAGRVDYLERSARRWRWAAVGLGVLFVGAAGPASEPVSDDVRTHRLTLIDPQGRPAAVLRCVPGQPSGLMFVDPGHPATFVSVFGWGADGSGLMQVNTRDGRNVAQHTGIVSDKGVPLEKVQQALEQMRHAGMP